MPKDNNNNFNTLFANTRIEDLNISLRTKNALYRNGIRYISDLAKTTEHKLLLTTRSIGKKSVEEIKKALFLQYNFIMKEK